MVIRTGILLSGTRKAEDGLSGALEGFALVDDDEVPVFAKQLSDEKILAEIFCAKLGKIFGLISPEPLFLIGQNDKKRYFGSINFHSPNLSKRFCFKTDPMWGIKFAELLNSWPSFKTAILFDESIHNKDRNSENLLWSDTRDFAIIDHEKSLSLDDQLPNANRLISHWLGYYPNSIIEKDILRNETLKLSKKLRKGYQEKISLILKDMENLNSQAIIENFHKIVCYRIKDLSNLIDERFPDHLFSRD